MFYNALRFSISRCPPSLLGTTSLLSGMVGSVALMLASAITIHAQSAAAPVFPAVADTSPATAAAVLKGISAKPDLVTVVPFYSKPNETGNEQTKVIIPVTVGNAHGNLILDTGDYEVGLNRTFLQPSPSGGVDSITDANRVPEPPGAHQPVQVTLRLGTLVDSFDLAPMQRGHYDHPVNAFLDHNFGNYAWVFAPRLGNLGFPALESFETIIDYIHRRVVFIRVDSAGRRLVDVPAYHPASAVPLVQVPRTGGHLGLPVHVGTAIDTLIIDTGAGTYDPHEQSLAVKLRDAFTAGHTFLELDTAAVEQFDELAGPSIRIIGYSFLRQLGMVGFNYRQKRLILYK